MNNSSISDLESIIFEQNSVSMNTAIFILGSPRTGSTLLYQMMAKFFHLPFISNFINAYYADCPVIGFLIQKNILGIYDNIHGHSKYGKIEGALQPSEGSNVMKNWFGGGHPSQLISKTILSGKENHFKVTLDSVYSMYKKPCLIKNAWNCFRMEYLLNVLPNAYFIWIKRDIRASAKSDLDARYVAHNHNNVWNSATPANYEELKSLDPCNQVVENQYEFAKAIKSCKNNKVLGIWYEDLIAKPKKILTEISNFCDLKCMDYSVSNLINNENEGGAEKHYFLSDLEDNTIDKYVLLNNKRFNDLIYDKNR